MKDKDRKVIDLGSYITLSSEEQFKLNEWLHSLGGKPERICHIEIDSSHKKVAVQEILQGATPNFIEKILYYEGEIPL